MASAKFLEEALSTDIDESAVSALVGSLENQLVTSTPTNADQSAALNPQNHLNSAISNGGTIASSQKHHGTIANGNSLNIADNNKVILNNTATVAGTGSSASVPVCVHQPLAQSQHQQNTIVAVTNTNYLEPNKHQHDGAVKILYSQGNHQAMTSTGAILASRVAFPTVTQTLPNGTIGLSAIAAQQPTANVLHTTSGANVPNIHNKQSTIVLKTAAPTGTGAGGLMTVPMNVPHQVNNVGSPTTTNTPHTNTPNILSTHLQVVNVRPGIPITQPPQKGQPTRVVLSAPQLVGARPGTPQLILQSLQGLQPGQQGQLLLKTENGQFQLLRVGPAPVGVSGGPNQNVTFRMQPVAAQAVTTTAIPVVCQGTVAPVITAPTITTTPVPKPATDNTKEKCRKFLANLLELSSREPKSVERNVRTLIQELIDMRVEPEDFCDRLERLLNASPQPCLIGFLKKSLPLLRHSLATKEMTIDGIRPPPANVVFSIAGTQTTALPTGTTTLIQTQQQVVRPTITQQHVRLVAPGTVVRPQQIQIQGQQRLVTPIRAPGGQLQQQIVQRMVRPQQVMVNNQPVIVSTSQPPALHPVIYNTQQQQQQPTQQQIVRGVTPMTITTAPHQQALGPTQVNIIRGPTILQQQHLQHQHLQQQQQQQHQQQTINAGAAPTNVQVLRQNQVANHHTMGLSGGPAAGTPAMAPCGPILPIGSTAPGGGNKMVVRTMKTPSANARMKGAHSASAAAAATSRAAAAMAAAAAASATAATAAASLSAAVSATGSSSVVASIAAVASGAGGPPSGSVAAAAAAKQSVAPISSAKMTAEAKKSFSSASAAAYTGDDDINDVAAMGGVNLAEETQRILGSTEFVGTQIRSCKEEFFLSMTPLQMRIRQAMARHSLDEPPTSEVAAVISHAAQERIRNLVEKLAIVTEHRLEVVKGDPRYEVRSDVKGQLKFLEELDRAERKRHEEMERELLLRAAKSRSKTEDPEQAKLKAKAKEMQRVEMEELRQREANATALQAIGSRKKPRLDGSDMAAPGTSQATLSGASSTMSRGQMPLRQRLKKVTMKDLQFMFESEKDLCKSTLLYKSYLK